MEISIKERSVPWALKTYTFTQDGYKIIARLNDNNIYNFSFSIKELSSPWLKVLYDYDNKIYCTEWDPPPWSLNRETIKEFYNEFLIMDKILSEIEQYLNIKIK